MCFSFLGFCFSISSQEIGLGTSSKWPILCRVGRKTFIQSINGETVVLAPESRCKGSNAHSIWTVVVDEESMRPGPLVRVNALCSLRCFEWQEVHLSRKKLHSTTPRVSLPEGVEAEAPTGKWLTQMHLEKWPLNKSNSSSTSMTDRHHAGWKLKWHMFYKNYFLKLNRDGQHLANKIYSSWWRK